MLLFSYVTLKQKKKKYLQQNYNKVIPLMQYYRDAKHLYTKSWLKPSKFVQSNFVDQVRYFVNMSRYGEVSWIAFTKSANE